MGGPILLYLVCVASLLLAKDSRHVWSSLRMNLHFRQLRSCQCKFWGVGSAILSQSNVWRTSVLADKHFSLLYTYGSSDPAECHHLQLKMKSYTSGFRFVLTWFCGVNWSAQFHIKTYIYNIQRFNSRHCTDMMIHTTIL